MTTLPLEDSLLGVPHLRQASQAIGRACPDPAQNRGRPPAPAPSALGLLVSGATFVLVGPRNAAAAIDPSFIDRVVRLGEGMGQIQAWTLGFAIVSCLLLTCLLWLRSGTSPQARHWMWEWSVLVLGPVGLAFVAIAGPNAQAMVDTCPGSACRIVRENGISAIPELEQRLAVSKGLDACQACEQGVLAVLKGLAPWPLALSLLSCLVLTWVVLRLTNQRVMARAGP